MLSPMSATDAPKPPVNTRTVIIGAGMSGIGTKAGGSDYLIHFTDPRACCENTLRSGFAPEL